MIRSQRGDGTDLKEGQETTEASKAIITGPSGNPISEPWFEKEEQAWPQVTVHQVYTAYKNRLNSVEPIWCACVLPTRLLTDESERCAERASQAWEFWDVSTSQVPPPDSTPQHHGEPWHALVASVISVRAITCIPLQTLLAFSIPLVKSHRFTQGQAQVHKVAEVCGDIPPALAELTKVSENVYSLCSVNCRAYGTLPVPLAEPQVIGSMGFKVDHAK